MILPGFPTMMRNPVAGGGEDPPPTGKAFTMTAGDIYASWGLPDVNIGYLNDGIAPASGSISSEPLAPLPIGQLTTIAAGFLGPDAQTVLTVRGVAEASIVTGLIINGVHHLAEDAGVDQYGYRGWLITPSFHFVVGQTYLIEVIPS